LGPVGDLETRFVTALDSMRSWRLKIAAIGLLNAADASRRRSGKSQMSQAL
jgi:hypothetical protein